MKTTSINFLYILSIVVIAMLMLNANPFKDETVAPMDLLLNHNGWQNVNVQYKNIHPERSDILDAKLPRWIEAKEAIYKGEFPLWNKNVAGGSPLLSLFTNSMMTPAFWTFVIIENNAKAFYYSNLINIIIGMLGMFLFLSLFFNKNVSLFGSMVFMFSGFNAAWFFWPHINTSIWIPWLFYFATLYLRSRDMKWGVFFILSAVLLNLGGFPMVAVMGYMALMIYGIVFLIYNKYKIKDALSTLGMFTFFIIVALMISIPFIYPLIELFQFIGGIGYRHGGTNYVLNDLMLYLNPYPFGLPRVEKTLYVGLIAIFFAFISFLLLFRKKDFILIFSILLFIYSATISFSLINPDLIRMIPTLNSNPWNRFNLLMGFSLAILATYSINYFYNRIKKKYLAIVFIAVLLLLQFLDQKTLFNKFNNKITDKAFYPITNSLKYIQNNIKPFQYVIADSGYIVSGTLGAYQLSEWYAHSFRSEQEKAILSKIVKNSFRTPTAAVIKCSNIDFESNYIDLFNIKYILCANSLNDTIQIWNNNRNQIPAPPMPMNQLKQIFQINKNLNIKGIKLLLATYSNNNFKSDVKLTLLKNGQTIAVSILKANQIKDNRWANFLFDNNLMLDVGEYYIKLDLVKKITNEKLTVWSNSKDIQYPLIVNGIVKKLSFKMQLIRANNVTKDKKYLVSELEPNIVLISNTNVKGSAYFLDSLTGKKQSYNHIQTVLNTNYSLSIKYSGKEKGFIVLPMRWYPGWKACINGKEVQVSKFLGIMPAIKVDGATLIEYKYYPKNFNILLLISLLGIIIIMIILLKSTTNKGNK